MSSKFNQVQRTWKWSATGRVRRLVSRHTQTPPACRHLNTPRQGEQRAVADLEGAVAALHQGAPGQMT